MGFSVFVSYSTRDLDTASRVADMLRHTGSDVYLADDSLRAGSAISPCIEQAIRTCDLFVLLWSPNASRSEWVPQEIGIAKGTGKSILPLALHADLQLPAFINGLKYLPWYVDPDASLRRLVSNVFELSQQKSNRQMMVLLVLLVVIMWIFSQPQGCEGAA